jgi:hypothetical protein
MKNVFFQQLGQLGTTCHAEMQHKAYSLKDDVHMQA